MVRYYNTSTLTIKPRSVQIGEPHRRRMVMIGMTTTGVFMAVFAVFQFVAFWFVGDPGIVHRPSAMISVVANLIMAAGAGLFLVINRWAEKNSPNSEKIYYISVHAACLLIMAVWVTHIHLAGTENTVLASLIPFTSIVILWVLNRFWAWVYWIIGSLGMFTVSALEVLGTLRYFPLAVRGHEFTDLFHDVRYLMMNGVLYLVCSILPLALVSRLHKELDQSTRDLQAARAELEVLASTDSLTGLLVRRALWPRLEQEMRRSNRESRPLTVVLLDIDNFKSINDTHGHAVGDEVLRRTAETLRASFRSYDLVARVGGEEFLAVMPDSDLAQGVERAEQARLHLEAMAMQAPSGASLIVTASFGVAEHPPGSAADADELVRRADEAHYTAKRAGKNRVVAAA